MNHARPQNGHSLDARTAADDERYLAFGAIAEEVNLRLRQGGQPDVEQLIARYPDLGTEIQQLVLALAGLHQLTFEQAEADAPVSPADESLAGTLGDYRLIREIGRGGMGVVYEAQQISLRRRVALKVLPFAAVLRPTQLGRFKNEALAAAALDHPNIVRIYAVGCERGVHYFAMQYVDGRTLAEAIEEQRSEVRESEGRRAESEGTEDREPESREPESRESEGGGFEVASEFEGRACNPKRK